MKTVCIQIENSDDKLSQKEWSEFCEKIEKNCFFNAKEIHFSGCSEGSKPWQNMCIVMNIENNKIDNLKSVITNTRKSYGQTSVAIMIGLTEFI